MKRLPAQDHDSAIDTGVAEWLLREASPIAPPEAVRDRLRARVLAGAHPTGPFVKSPEFTTVFAGEGRWVVLTDKVETRVVRKEGNVCVALYRLQPGGAIPPHSHPGDEESFVLEGTVDIGPLHCVAGDYHVARAGSSHPVVRSDTGCLFLAYHHGGLPQVL